MRQFTQAADTVAGRQAMSAGKLASNIGYQTAPSDQPRQEGYTAPPPTSYQQPPQPSYQPPQPSYQPPPPTSYNPPPPAPKVMSSCVLAIICIMLGTVLGCSV